MKNAFALVKNTEVISVLFKNARYGNFLVTGAAHLTVLDDLMVGGVNAAAAAKRMPSPRMAARQRQRQPDTEVRAFPAVFERQIRPDGDCGRTSSDMAIWWSRPSNRHPTVTFVITGVATAAEDDDSYLMVGPWIFHTKNGRAPRLNDVQLVAAAGNHAAPVPPRRGHVEFED